MIRERRRHHVRLNDAREFTRGFFIRPPKGFGEFGQFMDAGKGLRVKGTLRILFIDNAHHHSLTEREFFLGLIVEHAVDFVGGEHVFRIGIDHHPREKCARSHCQQDHEKGCQFVMIDGKINHTAFQVFHFFLRMHDSTGFGNDPAPPLFSINSTQMV